MLADDSLHLHEHFIKYRESTKAIIDFTSDTKYSFYTPGNVIVNTCKNRNRTMLK